MPYQAAILDLFGTLVPPFTSGPFEQLLAETSAALGLDAAAFRRLWVYDTDGLLCHRNDPSWGLLVCGCGGTRRVLPCSC